MNGVSYRNNEEAKDIILNYWGIADQVGEGKKYATKDEAIDSITGYDLAGAKALFNAAYDKAKAEGILEDTDKITRSHITYLEQEERITELANMLSGSNVSPEAINNARALLGL